MNFLLLFSGIDFYIFHVCKFAFYDCGREAAPEKGNKVIRGYFLYHFAKMAT